MPPQGTERDPIRALSLLMLGLALAGLLLRLVNFANPLTGWDGLDEMTYALIARSLMAGDLPLHGAFDHKPIALYYVFAAFFEAFGYTVTAIRLMPCAAIAATTWLLSRIARKHVAPDRHFLSFCVILFMTTCASFGNGGHESNTEILQMPVFAGWWLAALNFTHSRWRQALALGAIAGLAAQINYLGGFVLAVGTALILAWRFLSAPSRTGFRSFLAEGILALAAFIAVAVLMLLPLIVKNDLLQYFRMQSAFLGGYQGTLNGDKIVRACASIAISASFFLALLGCMIWCERGGRVVDRVAANSLSRLAFVFVLTLLAIGMTKRLYPHYFNLLIVPSTLILVILLAYAKAPALHGFLYLAALLGFALLARGAWDVGVRDWQGNFKQRQEIAQLTSEIRSHAHRGDSVLLLNINHTLYFLADVVPASRFVFLGQIFMDRFLAAIDSSPEREVTLALAKRPVFVMACFDNIAASYQPMVEALLASDYQSYAITGFDECRNLKAFRPVR